MAVERIEGANDLAPGELRQVVVGGRPICLARTLDGRTFAVDDTCSHEEAWLSEGYLTGAEIECPMHASVFDLATGEPTSLPATEPIATHEVTSDGADLVVKLADPTPAG